MQSFSNFFLATDLLIFSSSPLSSLFSFYTRTKITSKNCSITVNINLTKISLDEGATVAGIFFALSPAVALCSAVIWGACAKLFKFLFGHGSFDIFIFAAVVFVFLLYTHKDNLKKLFNHGEYKFNKNFS